MKKKGTLYVIPSYLSETSGLETLSPKVLDVIRTTSIYLAENVRTSRRFVSSLKLGLTIEDLLFHELSKKTSKEDMVKLLAPLYEGSDIGILSEAGCPGIADPGGFAVEHAHEIGVKVVPLVGPSSIMLGLMASGLNGQSFAFHGYLPIKKDLLTKKIRSLERESLKHSQTQIFIETPYRNNQLLEVLLSVCGGKTKLCLAMDITGENEQIQTLTITDWKKKQLNLHKKPVIFLLQG